MKGEQRERLAILAEEAGEVVQIAMKAVRHGLYDHHPEGKETNDRMIEREVGDLLAAIDLLVAAGELDYERIQSSRENKHLRAGKYLHFQGAQVRQSASMNARIASIKLKV